MYLCVIWEQSVLSVYHVDSGDENQVVRLSGRDLYLLSYLVCPALEFVRVRSMMC